MRSQATSVSTRPGIVIPPGGIGDVLDMGFTLARHHFKFLMLVYAWSAVPGMVISTLASIPFYSNSVGNPDTATMAISGALFGLGSLISSVGYLLGSLAVTIACGRLIAPIGDPDDLETGRLYRDALGRAGWVILWGLVLIIPAIFLLIIFPLGVYVGIRWSQAYAALVIDREGPISSLGRSWALTRGVWWHTFIVWLAIAIIIGMLTYAMLAVVLLLMAPLMFVTQSPALWGVGNILGSSLAGILFAPFSAAMSVVLYFELRARAEGFDLEQRALQVAPSE